MVVFFTANPVHQKRLTAKGNWDSPYKVSNILTNPVHRKPSPFCRPSASGLLWDHAFSLPKRIPGRKACVGIQPIPPAGQFVKSGELIG